MSKKEERFEVVYTGGSAWSTKQQIWVDRQTGVNYLYMQSGYSGGLTPILNRDGTPVVTPVTRNYDE